MTTRMPGVPPRPLAPGDVVAAFCEPLGEWAAAQITDLDPQWQTAGVLELDWSGPEPASVADLGPVVPLRLVYGSGGGSLSHVNYHWLLPRGCKVIGALPVLQTGRSRTYSDGWLIGRELAMQRRRDGGYQGPRSFPGAITCTGAELNQALGSPVQALQDIWGLTVREVGSLDCALLTARYPALTDLSLSGTLGVLARASSLNQLASLKRLDIHRLFGMDRADCLLPDRVPALELLDLYSIPYDYAAVMRARWRPRIPGGTLVEIAGARKPGWLAENRDNPLRDWDGRWNISRARFAKATAQYRATRRAVMAEASAGDGELATSRLGQIGRQYAEAFNRLGSRAPFIETQEREELLDALDLIINDAETATGKDLSSARHSLIDAADQARHW
jgi:hypothetical protein